MQCIPGPITAWLSTRRKALGSACIKSPTMWPLAGFLAIRMRKSLLCLICRMLVGCAGTRDGANYAWVAPFEEDPSGIRYVRPDGYQHFFSYARMALFAGYTGERRHSRIGEKVLIA